MHIITIDDHDFPDLLEALEEAKQIGTYEQQDGKVRIVKANSRLVMVSRSKEVDKIAIKPARNLNEAQQIALRFLQREEERGSEVSIEHA